MNPKIRRYIAMDAKELGSFISALRKENNMTQTELAGKLNVTDKAVSRWERGLGFPDINTLEPLADALGVSLIELMQGKRNDGSEQISKQRAEKLILDTIKLSKAPGRFEKMLGFAVLWVFVIAAVLVIGLVLYERKIGLFIDAASILFGLVAWAVPICKMTLSKGTTASVPSVISFSLALAAVTFQIISVSHDVRINDIVAVMDTIDAVAAVSCIFIAVTIVLNVIMLKNSKNTR